MTAFEATNSVFNKTDENNTFAISIPGFWRIFIFLPEGIIDKLKNLLKLRSQNDVDLHVEVIKKQGNQILRGDKMYKLSDFDAQKNVVAEELKSANYHDLEELVNGRELIYDEITDILDIKLFP